MKLTEITKRTEIDYEYLESKRSVLNSLALIASAISIYFFFFVTLFFMNLISGNGMEYLSDYGFVYFFVKLCTLLWLIIGTWNYYRLTKREYLDFRLVYDYCNMRIEGDEDFEANDYNESTYLKDLKSDKKKTSISDKIADLGENCKACGNPYRYLEEEESYWCDTCQNYYPED